MSKLIILSNRVSIPNGQKTTAGGLAVAIQDALDGMANEFISKRKYILIFFGRIKLIMSPAL